MTPGNEHLQVNLSGLKGKLPQDSLAFVLFVFILFCCLFLFGFVLGVLFLSLVLI